MELSRSKALGMNKLHSRLHSSEIWVPGRSGHRSGIFHLPCGYFPSTYLRELTLKYSFSCFVLFSCCPKLMCMRGRRGLPWGPTCVGLLQGARMRSRGDCQMLEGIGSSRDSGKGWSSASI